MSLKDTKGSFELEHQEEKGIDVDGHRFGADEQNSEDRVVVTEEDSKRILRKTDKTILVILVWVYLLQIADKSTLGYASVFGLQKDAGLVGTQYSMVGSIAAMAQLAWQPFSSYLIVRVPSRYLMTILVFGWGLAQTFMCISKSYSTLLVTRFFLGLFEAGCLPLFSIITSQWYMRSEQPLRVAAWYGTNGLATIFLAALSYGLGHIKSDTLHSWQILFLFVGLLTVFTAPIVWWRLDSTIATARFLTPEDRLKAQERLRANQTGVGSNEFKWPQVREALIDPKSYLWVMMALLLNVGASVTNTFGPLILGGLGFDKYITSLLNIPFGVVQVLVILLSSWLAYRYKNKGFILLGLIVPVIAGLAILFSIGRAKKDQGPLLVGYYLLGMLFGGNPLIVTWMIANTGGQTKKAVLMSLYNAGSSAGNIIGPLLFNARDKPKYEPGLRIVLCLFCALFLVVALQIALLGFLNKRKEKERVANGKPAKIIDRSMEKHYTAYEQDEEVPEGGVKLGQNALLDMTDLANDEFVYVI